MVKTATEIALMQAASDVTLTAQRWAWQRIRGGMTPSDIAALIDAATAALGGKASDAGIAPHLNLRPATAAEIDQVEAELNADWLRGALNGGPPIDALFHLASIPGGTAEQDYPLSRRVNLEATQTLLRNGGSRLQAFFYGLLPQNAAELTSYTVYRWECAIRSSVVLGFVGAGGLGQQLDNSMKMFNGGEVALMLLVFMALVALADKASSWLRRSLG